MFTGLRLANWPAAACKCSSTGLQSGGTATGRFKTACQWVPTCQSLARQDSDFQVEALAGDVRVMAGAGVAAGPAPYVRHQPSGDVNGPGESRAC